MFRHVRERDRSDGSSALGISERETTTSSETMRGTAKRISHMSEKQANPRTEINCVTP